MHKISIHFAKWREKNLRSVRLDAITKSGFSVYNIFGAVTQTARGPLQVL